MERIAYHPRLWRKHLLQYYVLADLHLPEIGLTGGETPAERALWRAAMDAIGVSEGLVTEGMRQYKEMRDREVVIKGLLRRRDKQSNSPYLQVSKLGSLFIRSAREASVLDHPDFLANREQLFWNVLVDFGVYYDVYGAGYLREAAALFRADQYEKDLAPFVQEERTLLDEGAEVPPDVAVEISGYARRALLLFGNLPLTQGGLGRASALGRFSVHLFKNFLRFVVGAAMSKQSGDALLETALGLLAGTRALDQEFAGRLDDLVQGRPPTQRYEGAPDPLLEGQVNASLHRLALAQKALQQAWADGWVSPEERLLLRYLFPHILGVNETILARHLS